MKRVWSVLSTMILVSFAGLSLAATTNSTAKPALLVDEPTAAASAAANLGDTDMSDNDESDQNAGDNAANDNTFGVEGPSDDGYVYPGNNSDNNDSSDDVDDNTSDNSDSDNGADD
jgi:hypothetical protein